MLTQERHRLILAKLQEESVVYVNDLVQYLEASESTIRRDLSALDRKGLLNKDVYKRQGGYDFILGNVNFSIFSNIKNNIKKDTEENSKELKNLTLETNNKENKIDNENFNNNLIEEKDIKKENNINMN